MQKTTMNSDVSNGTGQHDEISLLEIFTVLLRHRWLIIVPPLVLAGIVGTWSLLQDRMYTASASFMLQTSEPRSGLGSAASLARQFGITVGTEGSGQSPQFYADLLKSSAVLRRAVESEYSIRMTGGAVRSANLIDFFEAEDPSGAAPPWRLAVEKLRDDVGVSVGRGTGVVQLRVATTHPELSEEVAARLLKLVDEFNLETRQSQAKEESRFVAVRMEEARQELAKAEEALETFLQRNRQFSNSPELLFTHDRLQRLVEMRQDVYSALVQSYEQARIDAVRDTPVITVIDQPAGTAKPEGRGTVKRVLMTLLFGWSIAMGIALAFEFSSRTKVENADRYREFEALKRAAWQDIRHPFRRRQSVPSGPA